MHTYPMLHASVCNTNVCHASWNGHIAVAYTSWIIEGKRPKRLTLYDMNYRK